MGTSRTLACTSVHGYSEHKHPDLGCGLEFMHGLARWGVWRAFVLTVRWDT